MRLGTDTGSLINHVMAGSRMTEPKVGDGATILGWTDRHAGTIIEVKPDGSFVVQADHARRTDQNGMSESQTYEHSPNPAGPTYRFSKVKRGKLAGHYRENGKPTNRAVLIGCRQHYHDFSF